MERFCAEENTRLPTNLIDLSLKLSPCGKNAEERGLKRSSSSVAGEVGKEISVPSLERSCSLPAHRKLNPLSNPELEGLRHSAEGGVGSKQENDSVVSQKTIAKKIPRKSAETKHENPTKKLKISNHSSHKVDAMEILRQMPSVTTTGDGPNGRRIEGFLYKYRSGQVCIVCVCHGDFLTPSEFVMHAGGKEVANPMKHITVYSGSL